MHLLTQACQKGMDAQQRVLLSCLRLRNDGAHQADYANGPQRVIPRDLWDRRLSRQRGRWNMLGPLLHAVALMHSLQTRRQALHAHSSS